jgi:hypothetical protein
MGREEISYSLWMSADTCHLACGTDRERAAVSLYIFGMAWARRHGTNGFVHQALLKTFGFKPRHAAVLIEHGLWRPSGIKSGWVMSEYTDAPTSSQRRGPIPTAVREAVYELDHYRCVVCDSPENLSLDHVIPWSQGGSDDMSNLRTMCRSCNSSRGTRTDHEWLRSVGVDD